MTDEQFRKFKAIYKRFVDGTNWNNYMMGKGVNIDKDKAVFQRTVVEPMDAMWAEFSDEDKEYWSKVGDAVRIFNGRIV
ncbi:MAG TPA: hypothetical protein P5110_10115 [Candidatus Omnitrophota bacterium]|nr:hypothetical protein [Candidatus Omnitrophota bacterium]